MQGSRRPSVGQAGSWVQRLSEISPGDIGFLLPCGHAGGMRPGQRPSAPMLASSACPHCPVTSQLVSHFPHTHSLIRNFATRPGWLSGATLILLARCSGKTINRALADASPHQPGHPLVPSASPLLSRGNSGSERWSKVIQARRVRDLD